MVAILLILFSCLFHSLNALGPAFDADRQQRGLIMIIDDTEKAFDGAMSKTLVGALQDKSGSVIVSNFLFSKFLSNLKRVRENPGLGNAWARCLHTSALRSKPTNDAEKEVARSQIVSTCGQPQGLVNFSDSVLMLSAFDPQEWAIWALDSFTLLIPYSYLERIGVSKADIQLIKSKSKISEPAQKLIGLKLDNKRQIVTDNLESLDQLLRYSLDVNLQLVYLVSDLFWTRGEYKAPERAPAWTIYMAGHGSPSPPQVVGVSLQTFKKFLDFLETKLLVKLLIYSTCFGLGINVKKMFDVTDSSVGGAYSFFIAGDSLTDALSFKLLTLNRNITAQDIDWAEGSFKYGGSLKFDEFFKELEKRDGWDFQKIIQAVVPKIGEQSGTGALIRKPGTTWFQPIFGNFEAIAIDKILGTSDKQTIDVDTLQQKTPHAAQEWEIIPKVILINTPIVQPTLKINMAQEEQLTIVPAGSGLTQYHFSEISTNIALGELLGSFLSLKEVKPAKTITCKNVVTQDQTVSDLLIYLGPGISRITYTIHDEVYQIEGPELRDPFSVKRWTPPIPKLDELRSPDKERIAQYRKDFEENVRLAQEQAGIETKQKAITAIGQTLVRKQVSGLLKELSDDLMALSLRV